MECVDMRLESKGGMDSTLLKYFGARFCQDKNLIGIHILPCTGGLKGQWHRSRAQQAYVKTFSLST